MKPKLFYRNVRARDHLELFLVSAISTLLLNRFFLYLTHYPQVGGGNLHIAHMLYGGLLMTAAIAITVSFLGERVLRLSSFIGGVGFGLFIDELGKFITKDNDYFFRPTIGLIYAVFIILFLIFNFLGRRSRLSKREYALNALSQFEEAILNDLDATEKRGIERLLARADQSSIITKELRELLARVETVPTPVPNAFRRYMKAVDRAHEQFWRHKVSRNLVAIFFVAETVGFFLAVVFTLIARFHDVGLVPQDNYANRLLIAELISTAVASGYAIAGAIKLRTSRLEAFELFRRATLVNLLLTEFFIFTRVQFGAMPSFLLNLFLLLGLRYAIHEEQRVHGHSKHV